MTPIRQTSRMLHEEHQASLILLGRVERAFAATASADSSGDAERVRVADTLRRQLEGEVGRHFDFEERELFGRMDEAGAGDLATLLAEEHVTIRAVAAEVIPLARAAADGTLDAAGWSALRRTALELAERLAAHIDKEESALLAVIDGMLDAETDGQLALAYAASG